MKKAELIKILVEEYGYEKEDLKFDSEGKPYTNAKLKSLIEQEEKDEKELLENSTRLVAKKDLMKDEDKVYVMSGSMGTVVYRSEVTNRSWKFTSFGQVEKIPYGELVTMRNRYFGYFGDGWLIILDKDVQDEFGLTELYKNILTPDNLDSMFSKPIEELEAFIDRLPDGMKNTFINRAQQLYEENTLDSLQVVKMIERKFKFSLEDNAPIENVAVKGDLGRDNVIYVDKV